MNGTVHCLPRSCDVQASRSTLDLQVQNDEKPQTPNGIQFILLVHLNPSSATSNMSSAMFAAVPASLQDS